MKKSLLAHFALFFVAFIYAANFSIAKYVMTGGFIGPSGFILCRVLSALVLFKVYHSLFIGQMIEAKDKKPLFWCAFFGVASNQLLFFLGLNYTSPIHASLIMTTTPISVVVVDTLLKKSYISFRKIVGILIAFVGALIIIQSGKKISFDNRQILGDILVFGNAISYSIYLVKIKPFILKYHPISINRITFLYGSLLVLPFGFQEVAYAKWSEFTPVIWWAFFYVLIFTTFFAYYFNSWAMLFVSPTLVGVYIYLQPLLTSIIALIFGTDKLTLTIVLSGICIFLGVFLVSYQKIPEKV